MPSPLSAAASPPGSALPVSHRPCQRLTATVQVTQ
ncbi:hypothetical protein ACP70R_015552 [Stipagrostis hirtigluma subsp. patula]